MSGSITNHSQVKQTLAFFPGGVPGIYSETCSNQSGQYKLPERRRLGSGLMGSPVKGSNL